MSILQVVTTEVGLVGVEPGYVYINTDNTLAEVEAVGYLNQLIPMGYSLSELNAALVYTTDYGAVVLQVVVSGHNYSLAQTITTGGVLSVAGTAGQILSTMGVNPVLSLANTTVTPGSYTNTSLTVDAHGRLTAASSGTGTVTMVTGTANQIAVSGPTATPTVGFATNVVFPGTVTLNQDPLLPLQAATKQYVDMFIAGLTFQNACVAGTTALLVATYNNGVSGVGATLTNAGAQAAFELDDILLSVNNRVLIKNQSTAFQNGIYVVTTVGTGATNWVLTRATDYDTPVEVTAGDFVIVVEGTTNANTGWVQTDTIAGIGVSSIEFVQFGIIGTGVTSVSGQTNRITVTNPTTTPLVDIAANYVGQASITTLGTIGAGVWNGTAVAVSFGGTGVSSATAYSVICGGTTATGALQSVASVGTAGQILTSNGGGALPTWQNAGGGTVTSVSGTANRITSTGGSTPVIDIDGAYVGQTSIVTLGTVTTGTWNGTAVDVSRGGTGNTTFTAYSVVCAGITATGAFQNVSGLGSAGQVLTSNGAGGLPSWQASTGTVTSVSGTANRITSTGGSTPVIDIAATYAGQTSITAVGTITTGTWNGTTVAVGSGGTGVVSNAVYAVLCGGTTTAGPIQSVSGVGTSGQVLTSNGASALPTWQSVGGGTVTSVTGTANRITSTGGSTPVIDIDASYVGQASITTLGTVTTATWQASVIAAAFGGTGVNNSGNTITLGGSISTAGTFTTSGANALTLTTTGATNVTLPTTGTLITTATGAVTNATNSYSFNIQNQPQLKDYSETVSASGNISSTATFDLTNGNVFTATVTGTVTITFSNPAASGQCSSLSLVLTNGGSAVITWPASVKWAGGVAPTLTTSGVDVLTFFTTNAGTTWYGVVAGKAFA